jgi:hypothetical protein
MIVEAYDLGAIRAFSVHGVDPGETTGYAWALVGVKEMLSSEPFHEMLPRLAADTSGYQLGDCRFRTVQINCYPDENNGAMNIYAQMEVSVGMARRCIRRAGSPAKPTDIAIFEDFILQERTQDRSLLSPVRLTAKAEQILWSPWCRDEFIWMQPQSASDAKSTCTDDRMRRWGLWIPGQPHATDATRHLIVALRRIRALLGS